MWTIEQLKYCKESEDKVEFKKGEFGNIAYDGGNKTKPSDRRRCILGYVTALCNEKGGSLVIGMGDKFPHKVYGTSQNEGSIGELTSNIYRDCGIRPNIYELYENDEVRNKRVLVIDVPPRPVGTVFKFEDVALMRVGEELKPMSDEFYLSIIQEKEPDFSEHICREAKLDDIDDDALDILKEKYSTKQNNSEFHTLSKKQILSDLNLIVGNKITNAAIILLGKPAFIKKHFPQAAINLEFRQNESQISFDNRIVYQESFFTMIDKLWHDIDLRNGAFEIKDGPYIFNIKYFNEEVIREAINNMVAHRDYKSESESFIKQTPSSLSLINAGGFPYGVTIENILTVPSTPRNRLLSEVLEKTGIVERSGQGVDKMFYRTLSEGKHAPDYSKSDKFKVELTLSSSIQDKAFAKFIASVQQNLSSDNKLSVFEIITLDQIRRNERTLDKIIVKALLNRKLIEKRGRTNGTYYILCRSYFDFTDNKAEYSLKTDWNLTQMVSIILPFLQKYKSAKMADFVKLLDGHLTRRQIRVYIQQMVEHEYITIKGKGSATTYSIDDKYLKSSEIMNKALSIGLDELIKRGEVNVQDLSKKSV